MPGDRVVVVPNGVYTGGEITTDHPATNGPNKGWLVLVAQSERGVVVDLNNLPLELTSSASRIMFVGFRFIRGSVYVEGHDINFWYTDHTFPADAWVAQAPNRNAPESGTYRAPRTVYVRDGAERVRFYGSDLHDTSTAFISQKNEDLLLQGVNIWNLGDMGLDPNDVTHPDAIGAVAGGTTRMTVLDSWIRGRIMMQDESNGNGAPHRDFLFQNTWVSDSPSSGFTFISSKQTQPWGVFGARNNVWSWGHNNGKDRIDFLDGQQRFDFNSRPDRINVRDTNVRTSAPPGGAVSPSDGWRNAHPYGSWAEVFDDL
jgi:hypothetical protein